jgi:hypothetical protein
VPVYSRRMLLAERLPRSETPGFARNIANRLWALMLGRGLIHPVDLTHAANRPSHPELLAELEQFLIAQQFDLRALLREIALSETYQRSSERSDAAAPQADLFAVAALRGLSPEQFAWSLHRASGRLDTVSSPTSQQPAQAEVPPWRRRQKQLEPLERQAKVIISVFAPLPGQSDGEFQPAVDHALFLLNNPAIAGLAQANAASLAGRLEKIDDMSAMADELYLSVLGRRATAEERTLVEESLGTSSGSAAVGGSAAAGGRRDSIQGLVWGLMLSAEFRLNH